MCTPTPAVFNYQFPYCLSDEEYNRITQISSTLSVLTSLAGQISIHNRHVAPLFTVTELHEMLWGLHDLLDTVVTGMKTDEQVRRRDFSNYERSKA